MIYLAIPEATCMRELGRAAEDNHIQVATQLEVPYKLHTIIIDNTGVLDLRDKHTQTSLGLEPGDFTGPWDSCQPIGHAAWFLEYAGVLAPSATGNGLTLALFAHRVSPGQVRVEESRPLTFELYQKLTA